MFVCSDLVNILWQEMYRDVTITVYWLQGTKPGKKQKLNYRQKCEIRDLVDLGDGYDESDSFIDNNEAVSTTKNSMLFPLEYIFFVFMLLMYFLLLFCLFFGGELQSLRIEVMIT